MNFSLNYLTGDDSIPLSQRTLVFRTLMVRRPCPPDNTDATATATKLTVGVGTSPIPYNFLP